MKKILLIATLFFAFSLTTNAQGGNGYKNAIGIRGGWGVEVSYQRYIAPKNRIEATLGINRYGFSVEGMYQWMFNLPINTAGIWQWYAGAGVGIGSWSSSKFDKGFSLGVLGQAGIEYTFSKIPLMLSFDYRPGFYFLPETDFDWSGFALGVRFCF